MKKTFIFLGLVGITGLTQANTINAPAGLTGTDALSGEDAYAWGISIPLATGQTVASAEIDFSSIKLTASGNQFGTGTLWFDLLNRNTTGVTTVVDNDASGDYWATKYSGANISKLGSKFFPSVGTTLTWSVVLDATELASLNAYLANDGMFDIGLDPDCHYNVGGISFNYTLTSTSTGQQNPVPDIASTALLLVAGLGALEIFRRQTAMARAKA